MRRNAKASAQSEVERPRECIPHDVPRRSSASIRGNAAARVCGLTLRPWQWLAVSLFLQSWHDQCLLIVSEIVVV